MNMNNIVNSATKTFHRVGFQIKKHSPEILLVTGITGVVTSAVMACKATTKVDAIVEETKKSIDMIHEGMEAGNICDVEYTEEDGKKDLAIVYIQTGVKFAKLYGPSVLLGLTSIGCILASNNIIHKRNVALSAAYTAIDTSFKGYRSRVIERFGESMDRELRYNIKTQEVKETVVDEETGKKKTVKSTVSVVDPNTYSDYARFFDEYCAGWTKDAEYNLMFLRQQQNYANELLKSRGHLFLNEVYDMLGIDRTKAGNIVGWIYDEKHPFGDNFVDFGIYVLDNEKARDFVNGRERSILLDFNVDGDILSLMN